MRLDPITLKRASAREGQGVRSEAENPPCGPLPLAKSNSRLCFFPVLLSIELLSSHSELDPLLPIPNRAVKRLSADDSADYPRESRTLLGSPLKKPRSSDRGFFLYGASAGEGSKLYAANRREGLDLSAKSCYTRNVFRDGLWAHFLFVAQGLDGLSQRD